MVMITMMMMMMVVVVLLLLIMMLPQLYQRNPTIHQTHISQHKGADNVTHTLVYPSPATL